MYEYAATAIGANRCGASCDVVKIAVGPSAPPIIPIDAASGPVNPSLTATIKATYIPNCAAEPSKSEIGFAISGPKSVIAPTPMKIRHGNKFDLTPLYIIASTPDDCHGSATSIKPVRGKFLKSIPNAIGSSNRGSNSFFIARYRRIKEITNITTFCHCKDANPDSASIPCNVSINICYLPPNYSTLASNASVSTVSPAFT